MHMHMHAHADAHNAHARAHTHTHTKHTAPQAVRRRRRWGRTFGFNIASCPSGVGSAFGPRLLVLDSVTSTPVDSPAEAA